MAGMNGEVYIRGDKGEADIEVFGLGFFPGYLLSRVFGLLLQNPAANILIRATVDMKKETIAAQFDSRNRKGTGVSSGMSLVCGAGYSHGKGCCMNSCMRISSRYRWSRFIHRIGA